MKSLSHQYEVVKIGATEISLAKTLIKLLEEVFDMERMENSGDDYLAKLLQNPMFVVYAVLFEGNVVGGLTAWELPLYRVELSEMFLYDIGVHADHRRKGLGKLLMETLHSYCREKGIKESFLDAHEEDQHALDFYRAIGGREEKVVQFSFDTGLDILK